MAIYVIEYENNKPIAQYSLSGVSAGLSFIEEQEGIIAREADKLERIPVISLDTEGGKKKKKN